MVFLNVTSSRHSTCLQSLACLLLFFFFGYGVFWVTNFCKRQKDEWLPPFIYLPNPQLPNIFSRVISTFPCVLRDSDPAPPPWYLERLLPFLCDTMTFTSSSCGARTEG